MNLRGLRGKGNRALPALAELFIELAQDNTRESRLYT